MKQAADKPALHQLFARSASRLDSRPLDSPEESDSSSGRRGEKVAAPPSHHAVAPVAARPSSSAAAAAASERPSPSPSARDTNQTGRAPLHQMFARSASRLESRPLESESEEEKEQETGKSFGAPQKRVERTLFCGLYKRDKIENAWHRGRIQRDGSDPSRLKWVNDAGVSWSLTVDEARNRLRTSSDCPYNSSGTDDSKHFEEFKDGFLFQGDGMIKIKSFEWTELLGFYQPAAAGRRSVEIQQGGGGKFELEWVTSAGPRWTLVPDWEGTETGKEDVFVFKVAEKDKSEYEGEYFCTETDGKGGVVALIRHGERYRKVSEGSDIRDIPGRELVHEQMNSRGDSPPRERVRVQIEEEEGGAGDSSASRPPPATMDEWQRERTHLFLSSGAMESDLKRVLLSGKLLPKSEVSVLRLEIESAESKRKSFEETLWEGVRRVRERVSRVATSIPSTHDTGRLRYLVLSAEEGLEGFKGAAREEFDRLALKEAQLGQSLKETEGRFNLWMQGGGQETGGGARVTRSLTGAASREGSRLRSLHSSIGGRPRSAAGTRGEGSRVCGGDGGDRGDAASDSSSVGSLLADQRTRERGRQNGQKAEKGPRRMRRDPLFCLREEIGAVREALEALNAELDTAVEDRDGWEASEHSHFLRFLQQTQPQAARTGSSTRQLAVKVAARLRSVGVVAGGGGMVVPSAERLSREEVEAVERHIDWQERYEEKLQARRDLLERWRRLQKREREMVANAVAMEEPDEEDEALLCEEEREALETERRRERFRREAEGRRKRLSHWKKEREERELTAQRDAAERAALEKTQKEERDRRSMARRMNTRETLREWKQSQEERKQLDRVLEEERVRSQRRPLTADDRNRIRERNCETFLKHLQAVEERKRQDRSLTLSARGSLSAHSKYRSVQSKLLYDTESHKRRIQLSQQEREQRLHTLQGAHSANMPETFGGALPGSGRSLGVPQWRR